MGEDMDVEDEDDGDGDTVENEKEMKSEVADDKGKGVKQSDVESENGDDVDGEMLIDRIDDVVFCCFDDVNWKLYRKMFATTKERSYLWRDKARKKAKEQKSKQSKSQDS